MMTDFKRFEESYSALQNARSTLDAIDERCIADSRIVSFYNQRQSIRSDIDVGISNLTSWFEENFPKNLVEAYHVKGFSFKEFFDILRKHPELAQTNEEKLRQLLRNLWGADLPSEISKEIPSITELIPK